MTSNVLILCDLPIGDLSVDASDKLISMSMLEFASLTPVDLQDLKIGTVISPLFCTRGDCMDICHMLSDLSYRGRYIVIAPHLPNPKVVINELTQIDPKITVEIRQPDEGR